MTEFRTKARVLDTVQSRLPGVVEAAVDLELKNTLNELFTRTNVWRERIILNVLDGVTDYELLPSEPTNSKLLFVLYAAINGTSFSYHILQPRTMILKDTPIESDEGAMEVVVSLTLSDGVCCDPECDAFIPDFVYDYYFEGILDGTMGRLMGAPAKPYSDKERATYHLKRFQMAMVDARTQANASWSRDYAVWKFPANFSGTASQR
jgi:hypothetical protein